MIEHLTPRQAWEALLADPAAQLVDVRTQAEWDLVGTPDLSQAGKQPIFVAWQFPSGAVNPDFVAELHASGLRATQPLLFLCRSGVRSLAAAEAALQAGFAVCANVSQGFEGHPDARGRRGTTDGWQADGLPWTA